MTRLRQRLLLQAHVEHSTQVQAGPHVHATRPTTDRDAVAPQAQGAQLQCSPHVHTACTTPAPATAAATSAVLHLRIP